MKFSRETAPLTPFALGTSLKTLDDYSMALIRSIQPKRIVDVGAGAGKYGLLCREHLGAEPHIIAVDGSARTCEHLRSMGCYDEVAEMLLQDWLKARPKDAPHLDLVICGDVLEHLTRKQCFSFIDEVLKIATSVLVVLPLRNLAQGAMEGNPLEVHNAYLTDEEFEKRYVIAEKHSVLTLHFHIFSAWILAKKKNRWKDRIKRCLQRWGGHKTYAWLVRLGLSPDTELDFWRDAVDEMRKTK